MAEHRGELEAQKTVLWRGVRGLCPNCGEGKLFKSFITQNESCSACGEDFSDVRADDAPPWLTILITGHILVPLIVEFVKYDVLPQYVEIGIVLTLGALCVFLILPRAKGVFLAEIWRQSKLKHGG